MHENHKTVYNISPMKFNDLIRKKTQTIKQVHNF